MSVRTFAYGVLGCLAVVAAACGLATFVVQQYDGSPRPRETIAIIRVITGEAIVFLDGQPLRAIPAAGTRFHIEVLPGVHEVENLVDGVGVTGARVRFVADAGKVYRIVGQRTGAAHVTAQAYEVDRGTDEVIAPAAAPPN
jgi:hypothetical protein